VRRITHENALRVFRADLFRYRPKEKCTVAALRAESPDVDTSVRSQLGGKPPVVGEKRPVTTQDVLQQLATVYSTQPE